MSARRLALWTAAGLAGVLCAAAGWLGYRTYHRLRWYEEQFNLLILDPYQLQAFSTSDIPTKQPGVKRVVFYGDSRAASWPVPELDEFEFFNRGLDSQSVAQAAGRFAAHVAPLAPDVVVIQVGVNDLRVAALYPQQEREIYASTLEHIRSLVQQAQGIGATVVLTTIFPTGEAGLVRRWNGQAARLQQLIAQANAELARLEGEGVIVLDSAALLAGEDGGLMEEYQLDELHLSAQGYDAFNTALSVVLLTNIED